MPLNASARNAKLRCRKEFNFYIHRFVLSLNRVPQLNLRVVLEKFRRHTRTSPSPSPRDSFVEPVEEFIIHPDSKENHPDNCYWTALALAGHVESTNIWNTLLMWIKIKYPCRRRTRYRTAGAYLLLWYFSVYSCWPRSMKNIRLEKRGRETGQFRVNVGIISSDSGRVCNGPYRVFSTWFYFYFFFLF